MWLLLRLLLATAAWAMQWKILSLGFDLRGTHTLRKSCMYLHNSIADKIDRYQEARGGGSHLLNLYSV
eukprot:COSAG02_NODE_19083_length_901_cov_0.857855_2_plen_67_part_01